MGYSHSDILYQPSHVIWAPTSFTPGTPVAYGGTNLGYIEGGIAISVSEGWTEVMGEESGQALLDLRYAGTDLSIAFTLRQWDAGALILAFPGGLTATGATSGDKMVQFPGTLALGASGRDHAGILMIAPIDTTNGRYIVIRKAIPRLQENAKIDWMLRRPSLLPLIVRAVEDTSILTSSARYNSRTAYIGDGTDTVLTG